MASSPARSPAGCSARSGPAPSDERSPAAPRTPARCRGGWDRGILPRRDEMGRFGHYVIDADGHGGEPRDWRRRIPKPFEPAMRSYIAAMKAHYVGLPGGGAKITGSNPREATRPAGTMDFDVELRPGMYDAARRLEDMDLEGIDVAVLFPPGSGEEWALGDVPFAAALCRTLNDARAEYAAH